MTWIKICGTTNLEDALLAVEAGADALGFVFHDKSPRKIDPVTAREIIDRLPSHIEKVGVFVNETVEALRDIARTAGLSAVQLHGDEDAKFVRQIADATQAGAMKLRCIKALPVRPGYETLAASLQSAVDNFLLDSPAADRRGGTGTKFDWSQAVEFTRQYQTIAAGGLTPANVGEAISILHPWGVDVASGVEAMPGKKDPEKVRTFIAAVRQARG